MLVNNRIREKMARGEKVAGAFFTLGSVAAVEVLAQAGLDFLMIDTEHGPFDVETASQFIIASELRGMTPFVRVKDYSRNSVLKMLDVGAMGLLVPYIKTPDQVRELVSYGKYRPIGDRGCGFGRKTCYGLEPMVAKIEDYFAWANRETLIIPQCETAEALENIEEIAELIRMNSDCNVSCYPDIFNENIGNLEIQAPGISKASAIRSLAAELGVERTVVFGDNLNDLPMFAIADEAVAVANAEPEVKAAATIIIGPNYTDAVARFIDADFRNARCS